MNPNFSIEPNTVHIWQVALSDWVNETDMLRSLLSPDELQRANRLRFPLHRQRFIIARGLLRKILGAYLQIPPQEVTFFYGPRGKPYLKDNKLNLYFNVSHSHDLAVCALTLGNEIGIDVEKIEPIYKESVANRFFSTQENAQLQKLSPEKRIPAFYQIWASKEAIIKVVGEGLYVPLGDITIELELASQWISLTHEKYTKPYYLEKIAVHENYKAAVATPMKIEKMIHRRWDCSINY